MEVKLAITVLLTVSILIATAAIHFEALRGLWQTVASRGGNRRLRMLVALPAIIFVHLIEIGLYAGVYALAIGPLQLGHFVPMRPMHGLDLVTPRKPIRPSVTAIFYPPDTCGSSRASAH